MLRSIFVRAVIAVSMHEVDIPANIPGITDAHVKRIKEQFAKGGGS